MVSRWSRKRSMKTRARESRQQIERSREQSGELEDAVESQNHEWQILAEPKFKRRGAQIVANLSRASCHEPSSVSHTVFVYIYRYLSQFGFVPPLRPPLSA